MLCILRSKVLLHDDFLIYTKMLVFMGKSAFTYKLICVIKNFKIYSNKFKSIYLKMVK